MYTLFLSFLVDIFTLFNKCIYISKALVTYFLHLHYYRHIDLTVVCERETFVVAHPETSLSAGAPNENMVQNHINIALLNVF